MKRGKPIERRTPIRSNCRPIKRSTSRLRRTGRFRTARSAKVWSTDKADTVFSKWVRARDGRCLRCATTEGLTCSHFWLRKHSSTRFDPDNCIALCGTCHADWEHRKNNEYKAFMIRWLGQERYDALETRARTFMQRTDAIIQLMTFLNEVPGKNHREGA